jgi:predicted acyltransferase (DUF342 family)
MTTVQDQKSPVAYEAKRLRRKNFKYAADVHIHGDVAIEGKLVVGGNLVVEGSLKAGEIYCFGRITVKKDVFASNLSVGVGIDAGGNIGITYVLETGCDIERIYYRSSSFAAKDFDETDVNKLVHPVLIDDLENERSIWSGVPAVTTGGYLSCDILDAHGGIEVGDELDVGEVRNINGYVWAGCISVEGDMEVFGSISSDGDISVGGELSTPGDISCAGNIVYAGSIDADQGIGVRGYILTYGDITSSKDIQAGRWVAASGKIKTENYIKVGECIVAKGGIHAGKDYGIFAGMCFPRSEWPRYGYVSSPIKPRNIVAGKYIAGKSVKYVEAQEEKRKWEYDWEAVRRMQRELREQRQAAETEA